jgi:hypothetical protein
MIIIIQSTDDPLECTLFIIIQSTDPLSAITQ